MGDLEIYGNDEFDIIKINISEDEVLEQVEKTRADEVKRIQECSEAKLQNRATSKSLQRDFEKQGCFPRLKNFPVPKYESEMNVGNANPQGRGCPPCATTDEVNLGVQDQASWAAALSPQTCKKVPGN